MWKIQRLLIVYIMLDSAHLVNLPAYNFDEDRRLHQTQPTKCTRSMGFHTVQSSIDPGLPSFVTGLSGLQRMEETNMQGWNLPFGGWYRFYEAHGISDITPAHK